MSESTSITERAAAIQPSLHDRVINRFIELLSGDSTVSAETRHALASVLRGAELPSRAELVTIVTATSENDDAKAAQA